ncbi:GNAT family N-acetyltransferase [Bacillus alkalicellulosilyticus]|uniref:GNAT family N-acetyltransferase n=1 Tax=Alkalihalobacterium alkalicellulosilyticum TaxID=1912214 RepID=UPI00099640D2|nr:GNAT family protein [Bacillus alkalicellulosilyticus]
MFKAGIETHTYLTILETRHADELYSLIAASRDSLGQWLGFPENTNEVQDTKAFIEKSLHRFSENNGFWAGIWHKDKIVGSIGYLYIDWNNQKTEIGYWLGKDYEGLGLATKACRLFIEHAFRELQLNKVEINVAPENVKSRAIPERLGFTKEGTIRNYELLHGKYLDRTIYGLLKEEWIEK